MEIKNKIIDNDFPLVSVIIITYNSERYIIETLESVLLQKYPNIELIISDDSSCDSTIKICSDWIKNHHSSFFRIKLLTTKNNSGISSNCNRGLIEAQGVWIKLLAGDDAFYSNAIQKFIYFVNKNKNVSILSSNIAYFSNTFEKKYLFKIRNDHDKIFYQLSASQQYESLLIYNKIHALGVFIKKEIIDNIGGFDERYRLLEDHPMWLNITKSGYKFYYLNVVTGKYRIHNTSIFSTIDKEALFNKYYLAKREFDKDYILPNIAFFNRVSINYIYCQNLMFDFLKLNRKTNLNEKLYKFSNDLNPMVIKNKLVYILKKVKKIIMS